MSKRIGDFTKREAAIRKALFAVLHERNWRLSNEQTDDGAANGRWQFADRVIDKLRDGKEKV